MSSTTVIVIVVVVLLLAVATLATGIVLSRRRRISITEPERDSGATATDAPPRPGGYRAGGGISFAPGPRTAPPTPEPPTTERPTADPSPASTAGPSAGEPSTGARSTGGPASVALPADPVVADDVPTTPQGAEATGDVDVPAARGPRAGSRPDTDPDTDAGTGRDAGAGVDTVPAPRDEPAGPVVAAPEAPVEAPAEVPTEASTEAPAEEIAPTSGRLERLRGRLARSRGAFGQGLLGLLGAGDLDEESWAEVEDMLLLADLGAATTTEIVERLRAEIVSRGVRTTAEAKALLRDVLTAALGPDLDRAVRALPFEGKPAVVLVVGVNGTGKTTTTGKLARVLVADGRRVLLGAADTFRAAAADQLQTWGERVGAEVVRGKESADPAAVAFDAVRRGTDAGVDAVLVDTAGRLHTKTGLMDELGKVKRVVEKLAEVSEVLLVLDATTGQNGLTQARVFSDVVDISGIVLTKLDGTAKGGIVFRVQRELGVPVKLVGLGEGPDDLAPFEPAAFVDALLG